MRERENPIDEELARNDELIANSEQLKLRDKEVAILDKIHSGENLTEDELLSMDLSPETIKEYLETIKVLDAEASMTDEERAANLIKSENDKIEIFNQKIEQLEHEKVAVKKLDILFSDMVNMLKSLNSEGLTLEELNDFYKETLSELQEDNPLLEFFELSHRKTVLKNIVTRALDRLDPWGSDRTKVVEKSPEEYFNFPKEIKAKILASELTPEEIVKGIDELKIVFKDSYESYMAEMKEENEMMQKSEERLARNLEEEDIKKIRKKLSE